MGLETLKNHGKKLKSEVTKRMLEYILAAFGLVAGLAWNDAIRSLIEYFFPLSAHSLIVKFFYALLITLLLVVISLYLIKIFKKDEDAQ